MIVDLHIEFNSYLGRINKHNQANGWQPLFAIVDARGRADERARKVAERRSLSFDQLQEQGHQFAYPEPDNAQSETDDADRWLKENDPHQSA